MIVILFTVHVHLDQRLALKPYASKNKLLEQEVEMRHTEVLQLKQVMPFLGRFSTCLVLVFGHRLVQTP